MKQFNVPSGVGELPQIKFELFGDWDKVTRVLHSLGPKVKIASKAAQHKVGTVIVKKVRGHIMNQDLGWQELDPEYAGRKAKAGRSSKVLISYGAYFNNIKVWYSGQMLLIGVKKGILTRQLNGKPSKIDVATIAGLHEFSSGRRFARRPLWNPSIMEIGGAKGIKKMFMHSLVWYLRKLQVPVSHSTYFGMSQSVNIDGTKIAY